MKLILSFLFAFLFLTASAQSTHRQYLSGEGLNHTVTWDFYCSDGNNSQRWSKIEVPSQWELQGFGTYTYGRWYKEKGVKNPSMETGIYRGDDGYGSFCQRFSGRPGSSRRILSFLV